jgi:ABC-type transport system involved in multi-copper enzyme maturation permease subunit
MAVWTIAWKNITSILRNWILLPLVVGMPVFQIFIMTSLLNNAAGGKNTDWISSTVDIVILGKIDSTDMHSLFASGTLVQFLMIAGIIAASMVVSERQENTLLRIFAAPVRKWEIILGNLIGQSFFILVVAAAIILFSQFFLGIHWGNSFANMIVVTLSIIYVAVSMGFLFSGLFRNSKVASGAMSFVIIMMSFLSGSLTGGGQFPIIEDFTINKWAFEAYMLIMQGGTLADALPNLAVLAVVGTVLCIAAGLLYRRENIYE